MYYTQKRIGVIFFLLCLLIYCTHNIVSKRIIGIAKNNQINKYEACLQIKEDFFYNPVLEIIFKKVLTFSEPENNLYINKQSQKYYYTEFANQKYLVYFVVNRNKDKLYIYRTSKCSDSNKFFFISMLEKMETPTNLYFIDETENYIRRDFSYICNKELLGKYPEFGCHKDSYHIDLSEFV